jgi:hypothetical protein
MESCCIQITNIVCGLQKYIFPFIHTKSMHRGKSEPLAQRREFHSYSLLIALIIITHHMELGNSGSCSSSQR